MGSTRRMDQECVANATAKWLLQAAQSAGCNIEQLLWRAGIRSRTPNAPQLSAAPIPIGQFAPVFHACMQALGARARGQQARISFIEHTELLCSCVVNSATLRGAISQAALFTKAVHGAQAAISLSVNANSASLCLPRSESDDEMAASIVDFFEAAFYYKLLSLLIGEPPNAELSLAHRPPADESLLKTVVDCPMRFASDDNRLSFDARVLERPLCISHSELSAVCHDSAIALIGLQDQRISRRLEMLFRKALEANAPIGHVRQIARQYGKSVPTLRRHLVREGITFRGLLNKCRLERAAELLLETELSVEQIAQRLSFSTASGFSRAFKSWTGVAPADYRRPRSPALRQQNV